MVYLVAVPFQPVHLATGCRVPQARRMIAAGGRQYLAVRAERNVIDEPGVTLKRAHQLAGFDVPQPARANRMRRSPIAACRG